MFIDEAFIKVKAGDGGSGCTSFRREKFVPKGGPDGGNGGKGSNIIFKVDENLKTLIDFKYNKLIKGEKGKNGSGKNKVGKKAEDIILKVPPGTIVKYSNSDEIIVDLVKKDQEFVIAHGGRGGRGNRAFSNAKNPASEVSELGEPGEEKELKLELKLLADVGLVGMPSVGKSTILSKISAASPKIADYHFTTLTPNLGVVKISNNESFVVADLPGLIEGASKGEGLGDRFLKHIERTKIIAHVIDMSAIEGRDPYDDFLKINEELKNYSPLLSKKPQIIIANKIDIEQSNKKLNEFKKKVDLLVYEVSAIKNRGLNKVLLKLSDMLKNIEEEDNKETEDSYVLYKYESKEPFTIEKINNNWLIKGAEVERLLKMTKFSSEESVIKFAKKIRKMGIDDKLQEIGAKYGETIKILDYEFEFRE